MSRVIAALAAAPLLLVGGILTALFLLPPERLYLLGPIIAVGMITVMAVTFTLVPRIIRWRLESMFGGQNPWSPLSGPFGQTYRGRGAGGPFPFWAGPAEGAGWSGGTVWTGGAGTPGNGGGSAWNHDHGSSGSSSGNGADSDCGSSSHSSSDSSSGSSGSDSSSSCMG